MLATITSKGQVTVPKDIRDQLHIEAGTQLDFTINEDGTICVRPLNRSVLSLVGILKKPGQPAVSIEEMNNAVAEAVVERYQNTTKK